MKPFFLVIFIIVLSGCALIDRGTPVPQDLLTSAHVPGYDIIRYTTDDSEVLLIEEFQKAIIAGSSNGARVNVLAISGGGADGAFGAGLLAGWTEYGDRPEFQVVTGVSTGALISPFAFLGSDYDEQLRTAYTTLHEEDIFHIRNIFAIIRGDSIATTGPLYETISRFIDKEMLAAIASEHARGRRLFIMTTNLDAQRPVVWDMGAIAQSNNPEALSLFRRIIVASASIPVVFPPQYIEVEANNQHYTEMHVDGGVMGQVFLHLPPLNGNSEQDPIEVYAYVIRNSKVVGEYSPMTPLIIPIMARTISALILTQGVGDLYEIYDQVQLQGAEYRLAYVPDDYAVNHDDMFTPEGMKRIFDAAFDSAVKGYLWANRPPEVF